ncbi:MAG: 2,3-diketo-L-gulonate TRAP transporter small permease protein YiaM [Syntrophorhabdus sp. PtaU1.Bin058]|nr:MAG: 2,3-diketo-L-gulonate TRAP transporter small permease protein YiaM [Syntrophorhabdus sp. PtaU1.Bin058]
MKTVSPTKNNSFFGKILDKVADVAGFISMAAVVFAMLVIVYEVIARYIFRWATVWEVEAAIMATTFVTFVGSVFALKNNAHVTMDDIVLPHLKPTVRKWIALITSTFSLIFCVVLAYKSWHMFWEAFSLGWRSETIWAPPLAIPYSFLAVGVSIMCFQLTGMIIGAAKSLRSGVESA